MGSDRQTFSSSLFPGGGGDDAVCFTAGVRGAYFGAGVVHAYLASQRKPPRVAAGISAGALSAAALQRCYADQVKAAKKAGIDERARWGWFRRYLRALTDNPLSVLWDAIPDVSDFFADMPPISDASLPEVGERDARQRRYLLIKLGRWLANLRISVRTVADMAVNYVRLKEGYGHWYGAGARCLARAGYVLVRLAAAMVAPSSKNFFPQYLFDPPAASRVRRAVLHRRARPLFGWPIYFVAVGIWVAYLLLLACCLGLATWGAFGTDVFAEAHRWLLGLFVLFASLVTALAVLILGLPVFQPEDTWREHVWTAVRLALAPAVLGVALASLVRYVATNGPRRPAEIGIGVLLAAGLGGIAVYRLRRRVVGAVQQSLTKHLGVRSSLVTDFYLMVRLRQLFDPESLVAGTGRPHEDRPLDDEPMPIVLVAAPLQTIVRQRDQAQAPYAIPAQQVWAASGPGTSLVNALRAAIALPGLMTPMHAKSGAWEWDSAESTDGSGVPGRDLDLVDGCVIRQNPIPALFGFLQKDAERKGNDAIAWSLESESDEDARLHVVHSVPLDPRQAEPGKPAPAAPTNIVDVSRLSMRLAQRRDTTVEMRQTQFISRLEKLVRPAMGPVQLGGANRGVRFKIYPDAIAPETDISIGGLNPDAGRCFEVVAAGCRQCMQTLHARKLIAEVNGCAEVCAEVWGTAPSSTKMPGLPEVCAACSKVLRPPHALPDPVVNVTHEDLAQPVGHMPRVVFVASGGVFRGPFQVGVLTALLQGKVKVDLVVGASVGTLVGSVLAASMVTTKVPALANFDCVYALVDLFVSADKRVALTQTLKNALREIGIRARSIELSPLKLQRMMQRGSRSDPGFAAVGAPPAVLDAISTLLALPLEKTKRAAAQFASGHIVDAVHTVSKQVADETLRRLGIVDFLMGVSLLEPAARRLLSPPGSEDFIRLDTAQPFLEHGNVALFATTTNLLTWQVKLLGAPSDCRNSYDFVEAALSSSAFPAVFQPRREADIYPGWGSTEVRYADGGLFDNLPFAPALDILAAVQRSSAAAAGGAQHPAQALAALKTRHDQPDLIIAGSLDVNPETSPERDGPFESILAVWKRASMLDSNVKIRDFEVAATRIHQQIGCLLERYSSGGPGIAGFGERDARFINSIVDAALLPVFPSSKDHLNPTFAFCRTLGLDTRRIQRSVGDGCFQTLDALAAPQAPPPDTPREAETLARTCVQQLVRLRKLPSIERLGATETVPDGYCPFFKLSSDGSPVSGFRCPFGDAQTTGAALSDSPKEAFEAAAGVYAVCGSDRSHRARQLRGRYM